MAEITPTSFFNSIQNSENAAQAASCLGLDFFSMLIFFTELSIINSQPYHFSHIQRLDLLAFLDLKWGKPKNFSLKEVPFEIIHDQIIHTLNISQAAHVLQVSIVTLRFFLGHFLYRGTRLTYETLKMLSKTEGSSQLLFYSRSWPKLYFHLYDYSLDYLRDFFLKYKELPEERICNMLGFRKPTFMGELKELYGLEISELKALSNDQIKKMSSSETRCAGQEVWSGVESPSEKISTGWPGLHSHNNFSPPSVEQTHKQASSLTNTYHNFFVPIPRETPPCSLDYTEIEEALVILNNDQ